MHEADWYRHSKNKKVCTKQPRANGHRRYSVNRNRRATEVQEKSSLSYGERSCLGNPGFLNSVRFRSMQRCGCVFF